MAQILVVDDNPTFREAITEVLTYGGHSVVTDARVAAALIRLHRRPPDLIILDMWMDQPDSGMRFTRTLKHDPATRGIPVIVCSAHADAIKAFKTELDQLGCMFVPKPFDMDYLLAVVENATRPGQMSPHAG